MSKGPEALSFPNASVDQVWEACRRAITQLGYEVRRFDGRLLEFNTGRSMSSWAGQDVMAVAKTAGSGCSLTVSGYMAESRMGQSFDWGETGRVLKKFTASVRELVPAVVEADRRDPGRRPREQQPHASDNMSAQRGAGPTQTEHGLKVWIAPAPFAEGQWGTGPVDLSVATQTMQEPNGFDLPGGSGAILQRAHRWYMDAAGSASSAHEREESYLGAVRALNNLAVWCMTKWDHPDRGQAAYDALLEAEQISRSQIPGARAELGGILFNLGNLMAASGQPGESREYLARARDLGVS